MLALGIDENGLGPRLGPLVVTSVAARVDGRGGSAVARKPRGGLALRLGDSKDLVRFGKAGLGEAWARAIHARIGSADATPQGVLEALALDDRATLEAPCPNATHRAQCWTHGPRFEADDALVKLVTEDLVRLERSGITVLGARSVIVCNQTLNRERAKGLSRFRVDLGAMERLLLAARAEFAQELDAVCGKVGGFDRYPPQFSHLCGRGCTTLEEGRAASRYRIEGLGHISWVRDADASNLLVGMASLVGKWVREALMGNIVRFYQGHVGDLAPASGYHDPVTARFIAATDAARTRLQIAPSCFERAPANKEAPPG